jgi:hypothetical protein
MPLLYRTVHRSIENRAEQRLGESPEGSVEREFVSLLGRSRCLEIEN